MGYGHMMAKYGLFEWKVLRNVMVFSYNQIYILMLFRFLERFYIILQNFIPSGRGTVDSSILDINDYLFMESTLE